MKDSRFELAKSYLIDLLRAYGHRPIIVKINQNGEEVEVMARTFVKRQLTTAGITFPYNETNKRTSRIINSELDNDELSIIFHRAVFDFETAYVEEFCKDNPEAEAFVNAVYGWIERKKEWLDCTFSYYKGEEFEAFLEERPEPELKKGDLSADLEVAEEDVKTLKDMGYPQISSIHAMAQLFWAFASYRQPIGKRMKNAILSITVDEEAADYLDSYIRFYNRFIQERIEADAFPNDNEKAIKALNVKHQTELNTLAKKYRKELEESKKKHKDETATLNRNHQADLHDKLHKSKEKLTAYKAVVKKFRTRIHNPNGKLQLSFDLTDEDDIREFISWFKVEHRKVKNQLVKSIEKIRYADNPEALDLFKSMVEEYNLKLLNVAEDDDDDEETESDV